MTSPTTFHSLSSPANMLLICTADQAYSIQVIELVEYPDALTSHKSNSISCKKGIRHYYLPIYNDSLRHDLDEWKHQIYYTILEIVELVHNSEPEKLPIKIVPSYYSITGYLVAYAYFLSALNGDKNQAITILEEQYGRIVWPPSIVKHIVPLLENYYSPRKIDLCPTPILSDYEEEDVPVIHSTPKKTENSTELMFIDS